jgi:hypothetical protein
MQKKLEENRPSLKREVLAGAIGLLGLAALSGRSTEARAQDSAALIPFLTEIAASAASIYDTAVQYQKSFNGYVGKFNSFMTTAEDTKKFVDRMTHIDEVFHETKVDVENILKGFVGKTGGDWTRLRLSKIHIQSIAIAKFFRSMSNLLDDIERKISRDAESSGLKDKPAKIATVQLRKETELKAMRAEAVLAASSQRRDTFRSLLSLAKNDKAKAEAEIASSSITKEELLKRILEQLVQANRLAMVSIEIQTHGRPLLDPERKLSSKDFESSWGRIEKDSDYDA